MTDDPKKPKIGAPSILSASEFFVSRPLKFTNAPTGTISLMSGTGLLLDGPSKGKLDQLETELRTLRDTVATQARTVHDLQANAKEHAVERASLEDNLNALTQKQQLAFLLERVNPAAQQALLASDNLRKEFVADEPRKLFAMSVDIRRSTDLMLKARSPHSFASFITRLCDELMDIVRNQYGVVDKFTGDGILCFFPEFFSGNDAGYRALAAADACHDAFRSHYKRSRDSFISVLRDAGLGIGIDYGPCHLVQVAGSLTIVGPPVVYACRLGGAPAGSTYLNQSAYEVVSERHGGRVHLTETSIDIKHEGTLVAYAAELSRTRYEPKPPTWLESVPQTEPVPSRSNRKEGA